MLEFRADTKRGRQLALALEKFIIVNIVDRIPLHKLFAMHYLPRIVMWHLAGKETCTALGLVPGIFGRTLGWIPWTGLRLLGFMKRVPLMRRLSQHIFQWLARSMWGWRREDEEVKQGGAGTRAPVIPVVLAEQWGVPKKS